MHFIGRPVHHIHVAHWYTVVGGTGILFFLMWSSSKFEVYENVDSFYNGSSQKNFAGYVVTPFAQHT